MAATGIIRLANHEETLVTVEITMPIKAWRKLHADLEKTPFAADESGWYLVHRVLAGVLRQSDAYWSVNIADGDAAPTGT